ncbi:hypothetical protein MNBD_PLANCTO02-2973, partial [hydrothermal vent metagenome]
MFTQRGPIPYFIVPIMGLKPSPLGETFRFFRYRVVMDSYRTSSHSRYSLKYHFVWVTKYR